MTIPYITIASSPFLTEFKHEHISIHLCFISRKGYYNALSTAGMVICLNSTSVCMLSVKQDTEGPATTFNFYAHQTPPRCDQKYSMYVEGTCFVPHWKESTALVREELEQALGEFY